MKRYLLEELARHYQNNRQMILLSGPRQVGKTTVARTLGDTFSTTQYFNWDNQVHRESILRGADTIAEELGLNRLQAKPPLCTFDELHKYRDWRDFLKGFFDQYEDSARVLVTGSASLETFKRGGDSLMGRYFPYTLHPVSVAECVGVSGKKVTGGLVNGQPESIEDDQWNALWKFGGFPEPFLKADQRFYNRSPGWYGVAGC